MSRPRDSIRLRSALTHFRTRRRVLVSGWKRSIDNHGVIVLDNKPATWLERPDETIKRCIALRHVNENEARVNEVERGFG